MIEMQLLFDDSKARRAVTVGAFITFNGDALSATMIGRSYYINSSRGVRGCGRISPLILSRQTIFNCG